jgi:hypothetical protein
LRSEKIRERRENARPTAPYFCVLTSGPGETSVPAQIGSKRERNAVDPANALFAR